ncbi:hypothetical protein TWF281_011193 [Arthrobotrys megalospora]
MMQKKAREAKDWEERFVTDEKPMGYIDSMQTHGGELWPSRAHEGPEEATTVVPGFLAGPSMRLPFAEATPAATHYWIPRIAAEQELGEAEEVFDQSSRGMTSESAEASTSSSLVTEAIIPTDHYLGPRTVLEYYSGQPRPNRSSSLEEYLGEIAATPFTSGQQQQQPASAFAPLTQDWFRALWRDPEVRNKEPTHIRGAPIPEEQRYLNWMMQEMARYRRSHEVFHNVPEFEAALPAPVGREWVPSRPAVRIVLDSRPPTPMNPFPPIALPPPSVPSLPTPAFKPTHGVDGAWEHRRTWSRCIWKRHWSSRWWHSCSIRATDAPSKAAQKGTVVRGDFGTAAPAGEPENAGAQPKTRRNPQTEGGGREATKEGGGEEKVAGGAEAEV